MLTIFCCFHRHENFGQNFFHWCPNTRGARPAPPRPMEKQAAPPRPGKIDEIREAQRAKAGCRIPKLIFDTPFPNAHKFCLRGGKSWKSFSFDFLQRVTIVLTDISFKSERIQCFPQSKHHDALQISQQQFTPFC